MQPLLTDPSVILCINLVLPIGWIKSTDFFCAAYKTVADNANIYALDPGSTFVVYAPTPGAYNTADGVTASTDRLQYVDFYMEYLLCAAQGDTIQQ